MENNLGNQIRNARQESNIGSQVKDANDQESKLMTQLGTPTHDNKADKLESKQGTQPENANN